ncbi:MAG TPA: lytic transglycosylase domain-containing protein [Thermoanaerobaculia bacterium]|nr:lytic transglycosylase domain-containing protein [Thermoanaerobaculia bacterium]
MQRRPKFRLPFLALAAIQFLVISFHSTPSDPAIPGSHDLAAQQTGTTRIEEIAHWMATGGTSTLSGFHVFRPQDLPKENAGIVGRHSVGLFQAGQPTGADPDAADAKRRFLYRMPYGAAISLASERHHIDGLLLAAVVAVESGFAPHAVSPRGARGLMQVMPVIGDTYGARDLFDPYVNLDVGCRYLCSLLKDSSGNLERALAAYNAGPAAVDRYDGVPPYSETRSYVREVLDLYADYSRKAGVPRLGT